MKPHKHAELIKAWLHEPSGMLFDKIVSAVNEKDLTPLYTIPCDELLSNAKRYEYLRKNCYKPRSPNCEYDHSMELKFFVSGIWSDNLDPRVLDGLIDEAILRKAQEK